MTWSSAPAAEALEGRLFCSAATAGEVTGNGVDFNAVSGTVFRGEVADFVAPQDGQRPRSWRAWVDWGDGGRRTRGRVVATGEEGTARMSVLGRHRYAEAG